MVVAVDTGNRLIKTAHAEPFSAGLNRHFKTKPIVATDTLCMDGNYYSFSEMPDYHRRDKTIDDYYYVLTLAAIAREIVMKKAMEEKKPVSGGWTAPSFAKAMKEAEKRGDSYEEEIYLSVGLPPRDVKMLASKFREYYLKNGGRVEFSYNNIKFKILIKDVIVSPQGFAAILPSNIYSEVVKFPEVYIVDIGGYTTDIARVINKKIDTNFFESFEFGVIHLLHEISSAISEEFQKNVSNVMIEAVLRDESIGNIKMEDFIKEYAKKYAHRIIDALQDRQIDFDVSLPVFAGGGSQMLKKYLDEVIGRSQAVAIPDVRANAIGYEVLANRLVKEISNKNSAT